MRTYPCSAANHSSIDCALEFISSNAFSPEDIAAISVTIPESARTILLLTSPGNAGEAKFSVEYCIAQALLQCKICPAQFTDTQLQGEPLQTLMKKVSGHYTENRSSPDELKRGHFPVIIEVTLSDGRCISGSIEYDRGSTANPLSAEHLEQKFLTCASVAASEENISSMFNALRRIDQMDSMAELFGLVRA